MSILYKALYMGIGALCISLTAYGAMIFNDDPIGPVELYKAKSTNVSVLNYHGHVVFILEEKGQIKSIDVR